MVPSDHAYGYYHLTFIIIMRVNRRRKIDAGFARETMRHITQVSTQPSLAECARLSRGNDAGEENRK